MALTFPVAVSASCRTLLAVLVRAQPATSNTKPTHNRALLSMDRSSSLHLLLVDGKAIQTARATNLIEIHLAATGRGMRRIPRRHDVALVGVSHARGGQANRRWIRHLTLRSVARTA